jgi:hypothetical protein
MGDHLHAPAAVPAVKGSLYPLNTRKGVDNEEKKIILTLPHIEQQYLACLTLRFVTQYPTWSITLIVYCMAMSVAGL